MNIHPLLHSCPQLTYEDTFEVSMDQKIRNREKITEILGGTENYDNTPILHLVQCSASNHRTKEPLFIQAKDLSAPIMRGEDARGCPFIVIRFSINDHAFMDTEKLYCEVFYQATPYDTTIWKSFADEFSFIDHHGSDHPCEQMWKGHDTISLITQALQKTENVYWLRYKKAIFCNRDRLETRIR